METNQPVWTKEYELRQLRRIADLATNIAEDVIYMVDGDIVRHLHDEFGINTS